MKYSSTICATGSLETNKPANCFEKIIIRIESINKTVIPYYKDNFKYSFALSTLFAPIHCPTMEVKTILNAIAG